MRLLLALLTTMTCHFATARTRSSDQVIAKKMQPFFQAMTSTNNIEVFLNHKKTNLDSGSKKILLEIAKKSPSKIYHARILPKNSFALKLKNSKWAIFQMNYNTDIMMIGKRPFTWKLKKSIDKNLAEISKLIDLEYGQQKKSSALLKLIPKAYANDDAETNNSIIAGAAAASSGVITRANFLTYVIDMCGKQQYTGNPIRNRERARQLFFESIEELKPRFKNAWGYLLTQGNYDKFYRAQECLVNKSVITHNETWFLEGQHPDLPQAESSN